MSEETLAELIAELPDDLRRQALTHSSWSEVRTDSYERFAYLGDSVLALAVARGLIEQFPGVDAGGLTKIHNQAVSGVSCAEVGRELGVPEMLRANEPEDMPVGIPAEVLLSGERPLPEATEALIGACFLAFGFDRVAAAVAACLRAPDRARRRDADRLQVGAAGVTGAAPLGRKLRGDRGIRAAAPAQVRGGGDRRRRAESAKGRAGARRRPSKPPPSRR